MFSPLIKVIHREILVPVHVLPRHPGDELDPFQLQAPQLGQAGERRRKMLPVTAFLLEGQQGLPGGGVLGCALPPVKFWKANGESSHLSKGEGQGAGQFQAQVEGGVLHGGGRIW